MPVSFSPNDIFSLFYALGGLRALLRLFKTWNSFWDNDVTAADRALAGELALFVLIPLGVLLHEFAKVMAIRYFGGDVIYFQWRVVWGTVLSDRDFSDLQNWMIALSGNLVSILLGLLVLPLLPFVRRAIWGTILYHFAWHELFYALVWFPVLSVIGFSGEWSMIYNFAIAPFAQMVLAIHVALLAALWTLDHSVWAARWRIGRDPNDLAALRTLESQVAATGGSVESLVSVAYFYHLNNEDRLSRRFEKQAERLAPHDPRLKAAQALMAYDRKQYHQAQVTAQTALETGAPADVRASLQRVLALASVRTGQRAEALSQFDVALSLLPDDYELYFERGQLKRTLGRREEAKQDFDKAKRFAADDEDRERAQYELDHTPHGGEPPR